VKAYAIALFYYTQAAALLVGGCATLWWNQELMFWLIRMVGEERALGAENVIRVENGGVFLTNPMGMMRWSMPFWILGVVQISAACTLLGECYRNLRAKPSFIDS
jgi:hypothetical protein